MSNGLIGMNSMEAGVRAYMDIGKRTRPLETPLSVVSVCHILPALPAHGAEQLLLDIATHMHGNEVKFSICLISDLGPLVKEFENIGVSVEFIQKRGRFDVSIIMKLFKFFKNNRFDIVHTHLFTADLWGRLAALFLNVGVVSTSHTTSDPNIGQVGKWLDRILSYRNDALICVSEAVRKFRMNEGGIHPGKLTVIENGIDLNRFDRLGPKEEILQKLGLDRKFFWIAIVGRIIPLKGHRYLLEALALLSDSHPAIGIVVVGEGGCEFQLKQQSEQAGLSHRVVFLGLRRDVPEILKAVDLLAIPSSREGLPIVLLEAMASGLPVIATSVGGIPEVITDGKTGLLVEQNPHSIAQALRKILEDQAFCFQMGKRAREEAIEKYDIRKVSERYSKLYHTIRLNRMLR